MKNALLNLFVLILLVPVLAAQDANFIVREGSEWIVKERIFNSYDPRNTIEDSTFVKYLIAGDTLIEGEVWKKVWKSNVFNDKPPRYHNAIIEKAGKVYTYPRNTWNLLYDFGALPGDTVRTYGGDLGESYHHIVDRTDTVVLADQIPRKRMWIISASSYYTSDSTLNTFSYPLDTWIEGLGSIRNGLYATYAYASYCMRCLDVVNCYTERGRPIFKRYEGACQPSKPPPLYDFAPKGAKWTYHYVEFDHSVDPPRRYQGYQEIRYERDSFVYGFDAKVLSWERVYVDAKLPQDTIREYLANRYVMQNDGRVFIFSDSYQRFTTWTLLYDYNLEAGANKQAYTPWFDPYEWPDYFYIAAQSAQDTLLAGISLRKIKTQVSCEDADAFHKIDFIERIGSTSFLFYNEYICQSEAAGSEINSWQLRCYSDDEITLNFSESPCNLITSTRGRSVLATPVKLFPNPVGNLLQIESELPVCFVQVYNRMGQKIIEQSIQQGQLLTVRLLPGIYFLQGYDQERRLLFRRKVVKR